MGKGNEMGYVGWTTMSERRSHSSVHRCNKCSCKDYIRDITLSYTRQIFESANVHRIPILTVLLVVCMSYLLPNIYYKLHATNQVTTLKNIINWINGQVDFAEERCLQAADNVCSVHCNMKTNNINIEEFCACSNYSKDSKNHTKKFHYRKLFLGPKNDSHKEIAIMSYIYSENTKKNDNEISD